MKIHNFERWVKNSGLEGKNGVLANIAKIKSAKGIADADGVDVELNHALLAEMADELREGMVPGPELDALNADIKAAVLGVKSVIGNQTVRQKL